VFGGAFDPPHLAHVVLARAALQQLQLDRLMVVPTGEAWHKTHMLSPAEYRVEMTRLAFSGLPGVVVDERETRRAGPSYTFDTLSELRGEAAAAQWFLLLGLDQWLHLTTWHRWQDIMGMATITVAVRPYQSSGEWQKSIQFDPTMHGSAFPAERLEMPQMHISSTRIRDMLHSPSERSEALGHLLPEAVAGYISQHHLYPQNQ
jgi:nicotinate-nucleotide adenylyltransferase